MNTGEPDTTCWCSILRHRRCAAVSESQYRAKQTSQHSPSQLLPDMGPDMYGTDFWTFQVNLTQRSIPRHFSTISTVLTVTTRFYYRVYRMQSPKRQSQPDTVADTAGNRVGMMASVRTRPPWVSLPYITGILTTDAEQYKRDQFSESSKKKGACFSFDPESMPDYLRT